MRRFATAILLLAAFGSSVVGAEMGEDGYALSGGVKIHYVTMGKGPLIVLIHGFPDYC
jgi:epoxide hydrolase 4